MASGSYFTGKRTGRTKNSWVEDEFDKRRNFNSESGDHSRQSRTDLSESTSDPFDLDTSMLYFNVTTLQKSCKQLNNLKIKLDKKMKKKEKKKTSHQEDSKDFKKKKEAYREVYNEILAERAAVESIFDKPGRSTNDNQPRRQTASERQKPKSRPHLSQMGTEECEKCQQKEANIWKLKADIDKSRNDAKDLQHKISALETQIAIERSDKEDALRRLSSMASAKLRYNNPNIADLSDPNRPTKIAEKLSEIYDNEWTDAFDHLEMTHSKNEADNIQLLLNVLIEIYQHCNNQCEDILSKIAAPLKPEDIPPEIGNDLRNAVKRLAQFKMSAVTKEIKSKLPSRFSNADHLFQHPGNAFDIYIDKCIDACLHMSVQDPPMYLSAVRNKDGLFSNNLYKAYTKSGKYEVFIVWPVLYLHRNGQIMTKGVAQGTDDNIMIKNNSKQSYQQSAPSHYVDRRQHVYEHRQQHQHGQDWNQYSGTQTSYGQPTNNRVSKYPSNYRGQGYSNNQFSKTYYHPS